MAAYWDAGFCVREASWHGLENLLQDWPESVDEALPLGFPRRDGKPGHWEPIAQPIKVTMLTDDGVTDVPIEGWKAIVRDDDPTAEGVLSCPTQTYEIIGNRTFTEIGTGLMDEGFKIDTLFSVKNGAEIGMTLRLDEPLMVAGDDTRTYPFVCLTSSHDLSRACRAGYMWFRVVCANTIQAANATWDKGVVPSYTFKHTANAKDRIEEAKKVLSGARKATEAFVELCEELAAMPCLDEQLDEFLERAVPIPDVMPDGTAVTERKRNNLLAQRGTIHTIYESPTCDGHRNSALGLVDATVEYLDHFRRSASTESLVRRQIMDVEAVKTDAFKLAKEVCSVN